MSKFNLKDTITRARKSITTLKDKPMPPFITSTINRYKAQPNKAKLAVGVLLVLVVLVLLNQLTDGFVFGLLGWIFVIAVVAAFIAIVNPERAVKFVRELKENSVAYRAKLKRAYKELQEIFSKKTTTIVADEEPAASAPAAAAASTPTAAAPAAAVVPPVAPVASPAVTPVAAAPVAAAPAAAAPVAATGTRVRRPAAAATGTGTPRRRKVTMPGDTTKE